MSPFGFGLLIPRGVDGKSPAVNPRDHLGYFKRVLLVGEQRSQIVGETCFLHVYEYEKEVVPTQLFLDQFL